jgi:hypothetical protein
MMPNVGGNCVYAGGYGVSGLFMKMRLHNGKAGVVRFTCSEVLVHMWQRIDLYLAIRFVVLL